MAAGEPSTESQTTAAKVALAVAAARSTTDTEVLQASNRIRVRQQPYTPVYEGMVGSELLGVDPQHAEVLPPGNPGPMIPGEIMFDPAHDGMAIDSCGGCKGKGCVQCCLLPCPPWSLENVELFAGVQGFTGPMNRGGSGSFGFHEGANWGLPMPWSNGWFGLQLGVRATQSNLSGAGFPFDGTPTVTGSTFTDESRNQLFVTGGIFRRVDWGLQGGIVIDYLSDNWYTNPNLMQVRAEASWVFPSVHEFGIWFTASTNSEERLSGFTGTTIAVNEVWEPTDLYAFFYRHRSAYVPGAEARIYAGFSGTSDGLIGIDWRLPLSESFALESGVNYLIPQESTTGTFGGGHEEEAWNLGLSLVWYPGTQTTCSGNYHRPLMNVADNGTFKVDRIR